MKYGSVEDGVDGVPMNFIMTAHTPPHLLFYAIKPQKNILKKQHWLQFLFVVKATAINIKYQNFIRKF